jgi:subfamily B ATP-binding cassette protein MsbA
MHAYFGYQRLAWAMALLATVVAAITEPLIPALLKPLLDQGFTEGSLNLWMVPTAIIGVFLVRGLAQFTGQYALSRIANDGMLRLRTALFERLLAADMALFRASRPARCPTPWSTRCRPAPPAGAGADWHLARRLHPGGPAGLPAVPELAAHADRGRGGARRGLDHEDLSRRLYRITKSSQQATDELAYVVEENVLAHRMVRLHGAQPARPRASTPEPRLRGLAIKSTIASAAMTPLTQLLAAGALSAVICIALWQSRGGAKDVTVGGFVAFITAMLMLIAPSAAWPMANPITRGVAALERGLNLLRRPAEGGSTPRRARGAITLRDVTWPLQPTRRPR